MLADDLRALLQQREVRFQEKPIPYAIQFRCVSGEIFNVYDSGKVSFQGKTTSPLAREVQPWSNPPQPDAEPLDSSPKRAAGPDDRIFIVYGHDQPARDGLELMLRRMGMRPVVMAALAAGGDTGPAGDQQSLQDPVTQAVTTCRGE
jgi:predicted nucleotide-binding protein